MKHQASSAASSAYIMCDYNALVLVMTTYNEPVAHTNWYHARVPFSWIQLQAGVSEAVEWRRELPVDKGLDGVSVGTAG